MAESQSDNIRTLSEQYNLKDKEEKIDVNSKPEELKEVNSSVISPSKEIVREKAEGTPVAAAADENEPETGPTPVLEESSEVISASESGDKAIETNSSLEDGSGESTEESGESNGEENAPEEIREIRLETAPVDFRFPTTNQTRHCFTRYIEYHRCIAAKGEGAQECDKFAKYYRALCPGEWVERWNEQRANGTFPGPL